MDRTEKIIRRMYRCFMNHPLKTSSPILRKQTNPTAFLFHLERIRIKDKTIFFIFDFPLLKTPAPPFPKPTEIENVSHA